MPRTTGARKAKPEMSPRLTKPEDPVNNDELLIYAESAEEEDAAPTIIENEKPPIQESRQVFKVGETVQVPDSENGFIDGIIIDTVGDNDEFLYIIKFERNGRELNKRISELQLVELQVEQSLLNIADEMLNAVCDAYNVPVAQRNKLQANLPFVAWALSDLPPNNATQAFKEHIRLCASSGERVTVNAQMDALAARARRDSERLRAPLVKHYEEADVDKLLTDFEKVVDDIPELPDSAIEETGIQLVNDSGEVIAQLEGDIDGENDEEKIVSFTNAIDAAKGPLFLGAAMSGLETYNTAVRWVGQKFEVAPRVVETDEDEQWVARSLPEYFAYKKEYENCGVTGNADREKFDDVLEELAYSTDPKLERKRVAAKALIEDIKKGEVVAFSDILAKMLRPEMDVLGKQHANDIALEKGIRDDALLEIRQGDAYNRLREQYENATTKQSYVQTGVDLPTFIKKLDQMASSEPKNKNDITGTARRNAAIKLKTDIESGNIMSTADYQEEIAQNISKGTNVLKREKRAAKKEKDAEKVVALDAKINEDFNLPRENKIPESKNEASNPSRTRGIFSNYKSIEQGGTSINIDRRTPRVFTASEETARELAVEERMAKAEETPIKMRVERLAKYAENNWNSNEKTLDPYLDLFEEAKNITPDDYLSLQDEAMAGGFFARLKARRKIKKYDNILNRVESVIKQQKKTKTARIRTAKKNVRENVSNG